jgi:hypothetical protein
MAAARASPGCRPVGTGALVGTMPAAAVTDPIGAWAVGLIARNRQ